MNTRPALRVLNGGVEANVAWSWFCGHCAAPSPTGVAPVPSARVCGACGFGLLLETREDAVPTARDAFVIVDSSLLVQGISHEAELLLATVEELAIGRPVGELLVPADAESQGPAGFAAKIVLAADGEDPQTARCTLRPRSTFGVRLRARVATCGPPRAALVVLEAPARPVLRAV
ncbi:MAG: hypothetical protein ACRDMX_15990 [Solirubrobacteraceae bacterium]